MQELIKNFGLDWKLFLAQAANFFIVLVVLRLTIYKPLLTFLADRKKKIEEGIMQAEEAKRKMQEANEVKKEKLKEAEAEVVTLMRAAETRAKGDAQKILDEAAHKEAGIMKTAMERIEAEKIAERKKLYDEAVTLVKKTIAKTVEMNPKSIDNALIEKAMKEHIPA